MKNSIKVRKNSYLVFKRWSRKGYAIFNSLNKVVKITLLSVAYSIVVLTSELIAQNDTLVSKKIDLEEVIVSGQKAPVLYSQLSRIVNTVKKDEIKQMPVSSVNELLESFTGIDIKQRGMLGVQSDISIRGGSFDQNLILLNGVNISDPQTGHHSLNIPVDLNTIERIEILQGSGSRVFGPNAFSGAINIITNTSEQNNTKAGFAAGDFELYSGYLSTSYKIGKTKHLLSFSKSKSNGYVKNTDFNQYNLFYQSTYSSKHGGVDFQLGYTDKEFGANSFYTPAYPEQFEQTKTTFTSLKFEAGNKIKLSPVVYFRRHKDRFELFRYEPASWYLGHNYHLTDVYGAKLDSRISTVIGITTVGAELRSENIWSNVLGDNMNDTLKVKGEPDGIYTKKYARSISNYFVEHTHVIGNFAFSAGALLSWVSENDFDLNIYPGFDVSYRFFNDFKLYATINKSLRLPTFTDLFYSGPSNIGNPDLKPEKAWAYELGMKYNYKVIESNISLFFRDSKNIIEWVKSDTANLNSKWETQNLTEVKTMGFETSNRIVINRYTINNISINYTYLNQNASADGYQTKYSLNYLKHNLVINLNQKVGANLFVNWVVRFQDRAGNYLKYNYDLNTYDGEKEFTPFWLLDIKLSYQLKFITFYAEATNVLNHEYIDIANIEMPGRWFKAGFNVLINY